MRAVELEPKTVAQFHAETFAALDELGIDVEIWPVPVEVEVSIPFAEDTRHDSYDPAAADLFWRQLVQADRVLTTFRAASSARSARCTSSGAPSTWPSPGSRAALRRCIPAARPTAPTG